MRAIGRPRVAGITAALREETVGLLAEGRRVTVAEATRRAGTTPKALHRRYSTVAHLVTEVTTGCLTVPVPPDTGTFRGDVRVVLGQWRDALTDPATNTGVACVIASQNTDLQTVMIRAWQTTVEDLVGRAVAEGEVPGTVDADGVFSLMIGPLLARAIHPHDQPANHRFLDQLAHTITDQAVHTRSVR